MFDYFSGIKCHCTHSMHPLYTSELINFHSDYICAGNLLENTSVGCTIVNCKHWNLHIIDRFHVVLFPNDCVLPRTVSQISACDLMTGVSNRNRKQFSVS